MGPEIESDARDATGLDVQCDAWLRAAVRSVGVDGWDSVTGQHLLEVLRDRCRTWAPTLDRHFALAHRTTDPDELLATTWLVLYRFADKVIAAEHSWAYLWRAVRNEAAVQCMSASVASERLARHRTADARVVPTPVRVGDAEWLLDRREPAAVVPSTSPTSDWSPALQALLQLVVARGGDRAFWADAIDRAVDVLASARRSYEEHSLRRDPYLRFVLGLSPQQLTALGALLIGTRRGDRASQSLLLALHRDVEAGASAVPGAHRRMTVMLGRSGGPDQCAADRPVFAGEVRSLNGVA